jgi:hypothetical protein
VESKFGTLFIHLPSISDEFKSKLATVFTRFEDPDKAKLETSCNKYSGKWNFQFLISEEFKIDDIISHITNEIKLVLK